MSWQSGSVLVLWAGGRGGARAGVGGRRGGGGGSGSEIRCHAVGKLI